MSLVPLPIKLIRKENIVIKYLGKKIFMRFLRAVQLAWTRKAISYFYGDLEESSNSFPHYIFIEPGSF